SLLLHFFFQAEDGIRDPLVTGVQTCALPILAPFTEATDTPPARRRDPGSRRLACCELEMLRCSRQVSAKCEPRIVIEGVNFAADLSCGGNSWIVLDPVDKRGSGDDKVEQAIRGYLILQY